MVALMAAKAEVEFDPTRVLPNQIANSITDLGFPSNVIEEETGAGTIELEVSNYEIVQWPKSKQFILNSRIFLVPKS